MDKIIQTLNQSINDWLSSNGFDCTVVYSDQFSYDYLNKIISYTLFNNEDEDRLFLEICKSIYYDIEKFNKFVIYFFRQLGYNMTQSNILNQDRKERNRLFSIKNPTEDEKLALYTSYAEWEAISWACNYLKNNQEKISEFYSIIEEAKFKIQEKLKEEAEEEL